MENKLTEITNPAHIKFVDVYLDTSNASYAYSLAYPTSSYEAGKVSASRLLERPEIQELILRKQDEFKAETIHSREKQIQKINKVMEKCLQNEEYGSYAKFVDILNKMLGYYAPEKVEHIGNSPISVIKITEVIKTNNEKGK